MFNTIEGRPWTAKTVPLDVSLRRRFACGDPFVAAAFSAMAVLKPEPSVMSDGGEEGSQGDAWRPFSVVAPIDTGINVYHNHFSSEEVLPDWLLEAFGVTLVCEISTTGTYQERLVADQEVCWDQIGSSDIVYFEGTRIIGASPDWSEGDGVPILDDPRTGTARP